MTPTQDNTHDTLDADLAAYSRRAGRRRARPSTAEVLGYTAAAGGLAFAGGDAVGAIVHNSTGTVFSANPANTTTFPQVDLDGAGGADWGLFLFATYRSGSWYRGRASHTSRGPGATVATTAGRDAINLTPGFVIGPTLASGVFANGDVDWYGNYSGSRVFGPFYDGTTGYLGLRFDGDTGSMGTPYAWVKVSFDFDAPNGLTMNILEWAYDDSGAPIRVGDTGTVPTPATALLTLLGLGAMGVSAYRRRRVEGLKWLADEQG